MATRSAPTHGGLFIGSSGDEIRQLLRFALAAAIVLSALAVALLMGRRVAGAFQLPLPIGGLLASGIVGGAFTLLIRGLALRCNWTRPWLLLVPAALLISFAAAISSPGAPWMGLVMLWTVVALEEAVCWRLLLREAEPAAGGEPSQPTTDAAIELPAAPDVDSAMEGLPEGVTQRITRSVDEAGVETLWGLVRIEFEQGERTKNAHVAFCPPFEGVPTLYLDHLEGAAAGVRATQVESFGARLELRLDKTCSSRSDAVIQLIANYEPGP